MSAYVYKKHIAQPFFSFNGDHVPGICIGFGDHVLWDELILLILLAKTNISANAF